jgi:hypothetical protein
MMTEGEDNTKVFLIFLGLFIFMLLLFGFMSYTDFKCKCYTTQEKTEWALGPLDCKVQEESSKICLNWNDNGSTISDFSMKLALFILILVFCILIVRKYIKDGFKRPELTQERKEMITKWIDISILGQKIELITSVIAGLFFISIALKFFFSPVESVRNYTFPIILGTVGFIFLSYSLYRWWINYYSILKKKIR